MFFFPCVPFLSSALVQKDWVAEWCNGKSEFEGEGFEVGRGTHCEERDFLKKILGERSASVGK